MITKNRYGIENINRNEFNKLAFEMNPEILSRYFKNEDDRLLHIFGVVEEMQTLIKDLRLSDQMAKDLITIAYLHDIGYSIQNQCTHYHPLDGALFCYNHQMPKNIQTAVLLHSGAEKDVCDMRPYYAPFYKQYISTLRDDEWFYAKLITYCDIHRDSKGRKVSVHERLEEIEYRYGKNHIVSRLNRRKENHYKKIIHLIDGFKINRYKR